ncbi:MAG: methyl-accepting chemotaxis protein [Methylobacter sp.]|nr:methyl-accepting chemotaxis protein [Methylobacter sp.]
MKKDDILASRTNLKGQITCVNDAFVAISGYSREELIGSSHNIIRHPDMPKAAFEDLWLNLKQGKPWVGLLKNRTKSGDYYWVEANVIPIFKNGAVQEYLSIRYAPKQEQIGQAEQFYKKLKAKAVTMRPTGLAARFKSIKEVAIWKKAALSTLILSGLMLLLCYRLFLSGEYLLLSGVAALAMLTLTINTILFRSFDQLLEYSVGLMYRLADERFKNKIDLSRNDQIGDFYRGIYSMQVRLNANFAESKQIATDATRINQALDNVQSGVMVTDPDLNIIYMNKSVQQLFNNAEQDIRKQMPHFDASKLMGTNVDIFHKNSAYQRGMLDKLTSTFISELAIADLHMKVVVNPVINSSGERIGFVAEWLNRTDEVIAEQEISKVVGGAGLGDFTQRINEQGKTGFSLVLSQNINQLMETSSSGLNEVVRVLAALSRGDLTEKITNDYSGTFGRLKDDCNTTVEKLKEVINNIKDVSNNINNGAKEIASGNNDLSHRTEEQAASLEQTAASMEELTSTVQQNTANAKHANELAVSATDIAGKGVKVVDEVDVTMEAINEASRKIVEIISVIDDIAFQTNILALNAAVEAARAGDQGRGFAVVASEVRNLAQRAAAAAGEIKSLINDTVEKVVDGTQLVAQAGKTMEEIVSSIRGVSVTMYEISSASVEQTSGIEQVNVAISQMDDVTQQNAALVEQAAAAAESLEEQAQSLVSIVGSFKIDNYSSNAVFQPQEIKAANNEPTLSRAGTPKSPITIKSKEIADSGDWEEF